MSEEPAPYYTGRESESTKPAGVHFLNDPIGLLKNVFEKQYPKKSCTVLFCENLYEDEQVYGRTEFSKEGAVVWLDVTIPYRGLLDVLAHELAHVAEPEDDHGKNWEAAFSALNREWVKRMSELNDEQEGS